MTVIFWKQKKIFRDVNSNYSELLREKLLINIKGGIHNTQDDMTFLLFKKMKPWHFIKFTDGIPCLDYFCQITQRAFRKN